MRRRTDIVLAVLVVVLGGGTSITLLLRDVTPVWERLLRAAAVTVIFAALVGVPLALQRKGPDNRTRWDELKERRWFTPAWCGLLGLALVLIHLLVFNAGRGSLLVRLLDGAVQASFFIGVAIGSVGVVRTRHGRYCRRCRYEMSPEIAADPDAIRCPECGYVWSGELGTVRGRRIIRWPWIVAGAVVGVTLFALSIHFPARSAVLRVLPTASLIKEAADGRSMTGRDAWAVLMTRPLTEGQERHLARRLLGARQRRGYLDPAADSWLLRAEVAGRLPPDLARRYIAEHPNPEVLRFRRSRLDPRAP